MLGAIHKLGPSTISMIQIFTGIEKENLRHAIGILRRKGLVDMLSGDQNTFFYQLNQSFAARNASAAKLKMAPDDLKKPLLRRQDRYHNQWCEYWSWMLRSAFPNAKVVRDYDLGSDEVARNILMLDAFDADLLPDFLVMLPINDNSNVTIAFEIERTRKSEKRLIKKFRRYMEETRLDGVVYVCDSGRLAETLRAIYETKLVDKAERIHNYVHNFLLFSDSFSAGSRPLETFFNVNGDPVSLFDWCNTLCTSTRTKRREADFKKLEPTSF